MQTDVFFGVKQTTACWTALGSRSCWVSFHGRFETRPEIGVCGNIPEPSQSCRCLFGAHHFEHSGGDESSSAASTWVIEFPFEHRKKPPKMN